MSNIQSNKTLSYLVAALERAARGNEVNGKDPIQKGKKSQKDWLNYIVAFVLIQAMTTLQESTVLKAKQLSANASLQQALNKQNQELRLHSIPVGAKVSTINHIQAENEQISQDHENIQNEIITARQNAQETMALTNATINGVDQDANIDSGVQKEIVQVSEAVIAMGKT